MNLVMSGLDYRRAPVALRERLSFTRTQGAELCARLREQGLELLASVPDSAALPITQVDFSRGRYAIFIGNEGNGLTRQTISQCRQVTIPMKGRAESLNASAAATILLWELARAEEKEGFCG